MKIHEYQAKALLKEFGVPIPNGKLAYTPEEVKFFTKQLGGKSVVKAQVHAGGRGKAGGVKIAKSADEAYEIAKQMIGMKLVTHQTGPEGKIVRKVLVEEAMEIVQELYLGMVIDRSSSRVVIMASEAGGMEIEEVAAKTPEKIHKAYVDPAVGFSAYIGRKLAYDMGLTKEQVKQFVKFVNGLYNLFIAKDASLAEINPLVITGDGRMLALDAKINFDDNGLFRHPDIADLIDPSEEDQGELEAGEWGLSYVKLEGNIGCMVNGAGLAMATMDIIKLAGGEPANFLDVGGGANADRVAKAFEIILSDPNVNAILVNIFGGIVRGDRVAEGIIKAVQVKEVKVPVVVRLQGTNADIARKMLEESGLKFTVAENLEEAAEKVVQLSKG